MNKAYILVGWWSGTCRTVLDLLAVSQVAVAEDKGDVTWQGTGM